VRHRKPRGTTYLNGESQQVSIYSRRRAVVLGGTIAPTCYAFEPQMANRTVKKPKPRFESSTFRWLFGHVFSLLRRHGATIVIWSVIGWSVHEVALVFIAYAGKASVADLTLRMLANVSVVWSLSLTLSGISITLYIRERMLHRRTRERLTARITDLELKIDPNRTSSLLTPQGTTRKGDE